jgi:mono/diheme cytochrome c family protein
MKRLIALSVFVVFAVSITARAAEPTEETKALWMKHCKKCHGVEGKGETTMGKKMGAKDLTDPKVQAKYTDEQFIKMIKDGVKNKKGKTTMPRAKKLSDEQIKALTAFVRTLKK